LTLVPNDPGSRYKTKQLQVQTVGKSKMIKSFFLNINEVAKTMQVPPSYIVHFIAYSIGTKATYDVKKPERQQAFLTGEHDMKDLSRWTLAFINEVLLCANCGLPELLITIEKSQPVGSCRACGSSKPLPITNERFKKHIVNHPPTTKGAFSGNEAGNKRGGSNKRDKKNKKAEDEAEESEEEDSDDDDNVVWFSDTSAEAMKKRREQLMVDTELTSDTTASEKEEVTEGVEKLKIKKEKKEKKSKEPAAPEEPEEKGFAADMKKLLKTSNNDVFATVKKDEFKNLLKSEPQDKFLDWLEAHMTKQKNVAKIAHVVKELYDEDLLEEENVIAWYKKNNNSAVKSSLAPLVKWFEEAEEESEDEEEEDDE